MKLGVLKLGQLIIGICFISYFLSCKNETVEKAKLEPVQIVEEMLEPDNVTLKGILGKAVSISEKGRITTLPEWEKGQLFSMFSKQSRQKNKEVDWYGEHGGKWLFMTAIAAKRTGDKEMKTLLLKTADALINTQEEDGYLGTYSPTQRFTSNKAKTHKWSWDVWNMSYMVLGLLEVNRYFPNEKYLKAAEKIGELFLNTFLVKNKNITNYGTNYGLSATVIIEPLVELYKTTNDQRYIDLAEKVITEIEDREEFRLISQMLNNKDLVKVGKGKAYQLCWNLTGIAKLYEVTANPDYLQAVKNAWQNIVDVHLSITGGPSGGIGKHYELFNRKKFWSPYGFVETCSIMSWIELNRQLLRITGEVKYAQQIETTVYNALLGAQYPDGENWCYHSFTNGQRHVAEHNDCCPSSGVIALEEISNIVFGIKDRGIACNLYTACKAKISIDESNIIEIEQKTDYPNDGNVLLTLHVQKSLTFPLFIRIPEWAESSLFSVNGQSFDTVLEDNGYAKIERQWQDGDQVNINFPMTYQVHKKMENIPQRGKNISSIEWFAITRGPLVYAVDGLLFGKQRESVVNLSDDQIKSSLKQDKLSPEFQLMLPDNKSLRFLPFYLADAREPGAWRLTWIQNKIN